MRISDWSSDVCSSDLGKTGRRPEGDEIAPDRPTVLRRPGGTAPGPVPGQAAVQPQDEIQQANQEKRRYPEQTGARPPARRIARHRPATRGTRAPQPASSARTLTRNAMDNARQNNRRAHYLETPRSAR